ncbi:aspartate/tyrosine/aromatic aminotransferase [Tessaracoccus sp. OS52]|uniref:amino acid aminotransferase n=1 Tax=Tessaracoccus sp. OS52 TaxID=2886691 RepID=UPI001D10895F|nr:amino acid aminotransferase [Tessaracoccus sp. OS52]MCC2593110.1 aspartate/tyrosine/aromatic aminotransferase [Tessaracoccus sp. OS52]
MTILDRTELAPADPILGLTEAFNSDDRTTKVNLGVGVYLGEDGRIPLLDSVRAAEERLTKAARPHGYLGIDGLASYNVATKELVFGADSDAVGSGRITTVQTLGGTGALKVAADFLRTIDGDATVLISSPSWENHRALFTRAGYPVEEYRYYSRETRGIDFDGMLEDLRAAAPGTIVVLHACCHNPTGYDLDSAQWDRVISVIREGELVALVDMAYQGFGFGIEEDGAVIGKFIDAGLEFLVTTSFSKSFSLYGERIGALHVVSPDAETARKVLSQLKICIRTNYSNPATQGAALVDTILRDPELRASWENELAGMRNRIKSLRGRLVQGLREHGIEDMDFINDQLGMFSYSGLSKDQMIALRTEHAVYGTDSGRMCVAALNSSNVDHVAQAIAAVR